LESVIVSLAIVALCVTIIPVLSLKAKLPGIVGVFLAGLILGPYGLGVIAQEYDWLSCLALLGIIFLMFLAGFETKLSELKQEMKPVVLVGAVCFAIPFAVGFLAAWLVGGNLLEILFVSLVFSTGSAGILFPIISRLGLMQQRIGRIILGASVVDEVLSLVALTFLVEIVGSGFVVFGVRFPQFSLWNLAVFAVEIVLFVVVLWFFPRFASHVFQRSKNVKVPEFSVRLVVLLILGLSAVSELLSFEAVLGAFVAGLAMSELEHEEHGLDIKTQEKIHAIGYGLLVPIFFFDVGVSTNLQNIGLNIQLITITLLLILAAILSKIAAGYLAAALLKFPRRDSLAVGVSAVARLSVGLVIADIGLRKQIISQNIFTMLVLISIVTSIVALILLTKATTGKLGFTIE